MQVNVNEVGLAVFEVAKTAVVIVWMFDLAVLIFCVVASWVCP